MNATHTFNGDSGSSDGNRVAESAYEPGSGSTIMAYAGICSGQNVQSNSDDYFHSRSFEEMNDFAFLSPTCGTLPVVAGNSPPTVDAGPNHTIPRGTPFTLTATVNDPDGDPVTANWEQFDSGFMVGLPDANDPAGPLFRSRHPTASPSRTFPRFEDILEPPAGTSYEVLPMVNRILSFRATARDNRGGVQYDSTQVSVVGSPFSITFPSEGAKTECGLPVDVTWNVGGSASLSPLVAMKFSDANGANFSLFATAHNDGAEEVVLPRIPVDNTARLMLESIGNIFFNVSRPFSIEDTLPPTVTAPPNIVEECTSPAGTPVNLGTANATDICYEGPLSVSNNAPALFLLGDTTVTWSSTDPSGNTGTGTQLVTIEDTTPPQLEIAVSPTVLWPPQHQMVRINVEVLVLEDACDAAPTLQLLSITANEPDNSQGDGFTVDDMQDAEFGTDDREFFLRAERRGLGTGRIYTITYRATDASGNFTDRSVQVRVPQSQGN